MFRKMRRQEKEINNTEIIRVLESGLYGVLSTVGEDEYAYGVPVSYVFCDDCIYFHCAVEGAKLYNIQYNNKVSFCVVEEAETIPEDFSMKFESVILFGKASEAYYDEKQKALLAILNKYSPQFMDKGRKYIENASSRTKVIKIEIEHMTGKAKR